MKVRLNGTTCDEMDNRAWRFARPDDVQAGDYIEVGMLGAYGAAMRTGFNGFTAGDTVTVTDEPMASLYMPAEQPSTVVEIARKLLQQADRNGSIHALRHSGDSWNPFCFGMESGLHRGAGELIGTEMILEFGMHDPLVNDHRKAELSRTKIKHKD